MNLHEQVEDMVRKAVVFDGLTVIVSSPYSRPQLNNTIWYMPVSVLVAEGTPETIVEAGAEALESLNRIEWLTVGLFDYLPDDVGFPNPSKPIQEFWTEIIYVGDSQGNPLKY